MSANALATARIEQSIKDTAAEVLRESGLTVSDAIRLLLTKIAKEHEVPFNMIMSNKHTVAAIQNARKGKVKSFNTVSDLMTELNK